MATQPLTIERFSGLNLVDDPLEVGAQGSTDMLNADLDQLGRVRCRDGFAKYTASALSANVSSIASLPPLGGSGDVLAWAAGVYYAIDETGTVIDSDGPGANSTAAMFLPRGSTSLATTDVSGRLMTYSGGAGWAHVDLGGSVADADSWSVIAQTPVSNRVVLTGGSSFFDRVVFSDANIIPSWTAANWVEVGKEDGDVVSSAAVYRDLLLVFKRTKFFVFTGESTSGTGAPVFNYRAVNTGVGCVARFATASAPEGVYFLSADGVYLTQGDAPRKVSRAIDPLFRGDLNDSYTGSAINFDAIAASAMTYLRGRLYVAVPTGSATTNDRLLVYDTASDSWLVWSIAASCLTPWRPLVSLLFQREELLFGFPSGTNDIGRHARAYTTDNGSAIAWNRKSGRYSLADPGHVAVTPESSLVGSGTVTLRLDSDLYSNQSASATLGTAPAIAEGWPSPVDTEGTWLQHKMSGSGPGSVSRLTHHISFVKPAGVR